MVIKVTVGVTAVQLPFGEADRPVVQNLGPGDVYLGDGPTVSANNGIKLEPGVGYEFPNTLKKISDWKGVWVIASEAGTDVRVANVG